MNTGGASRVGDKKRLLTKIFAAGAIGVCLAAGAKFADDEIMLRGAKSGVPWMVDFAINVLGADVHAENEDVLFRAAGWGHTETVKILLKAGADPHALEDYALRQAAAHGYTQTVITLLGAGVDVHARDDEALRLAAFNGHTATVRALLGAGADVRARGGEALRWAEENGQTETAAVLREHMAHRESTRTLHQTGMSRG